MPRQRQAAFVAIDLLLAMGIIAALAILLSAAVHGQRVAEANLSASRSALHLAERTLLNLQHGQPMPATTGDTRLDIQTLPGGDVPAGYVWAKVRASVAKHERSQIGIVPTDSLKLGGGPK